MHQRLWLIIGRRANGTLLGDEEWAACIRAVQATLKSGRVAVKFAGAGQLWSEEGAPGQDAFAVVGEVEPAGLHAARTMVHLAVEDWHLDSVETVFEPFEHFSARLSDEQVER